MDPRTSAKLQRAEKRAHCEGTHVVRMFKDGGMWKFEVATPGKSSRIVELQFGRLWCMCDWSMFHTMDDEVCRHRGTVHEYLVARNLSLEKLNKKRS